MEAEHRRTVRLRKYKRRGDALRGVLPRLHAQIMIQLVVAAIEGLAVVRLFKRSNVFRE